MFNKTIVIISMLFTGLLITWGLTGDTPLACEGDEMYCVGPALEMVRRNEINPHWLAHPASTTIYPLFFYYHFLNAQHFHGQLVSYSTNSENLIFDYTYLLCYLPRFINVFFVVSSLPLLYLIGRDVFSRTTGLLALWLFPISSLLLEYVQVIRSEGPALFFSILAIYLSLKLYNKPTLRLHVLTGAVIGLAVSSRYPMLALVVLFLLADLFHAWRETDFKLKRKYALFGAVGLATVVATFALTTPFFFLDFKTFLQDMSVERAAHGLGVDGLSTLGNLSYYLFDAIPRRFFPVQTWLALIGIVAALVRRNFAAVLLIVYMIAVIAGTCLHPFHTDKWLIPILPIMALFAGYAISLLLDLLRFGSTKFLKLELAPFVSATVAAALLAYFEWSPFLECCVYNTVKINFSTKPLFYKWVFEHVPAGTKICVVGGIWEGGHREHFKTKDFLYDPSYFDGECSGKYVSPTDLYHQGYQYFICSDSHYPVYLAEAKRYPREAKFFNEFFAETTLVKEELPIELSVGGLLKAKQRGAKFGLYKFTGKEEQSINSDHAVDAPH